MSTFITTLDATGDGPRLAVKDLIDVEGVPTTAGSKAVADRAQPALADAPCLAGARVARARIVGKVNLHELAFGASGINPWFGTPVNPQHASLMPGGSSSGSAVAVGNGDADVALGSDTAGSVRIPSACCATAGLKTSYGRVSLSGVWPLSPSLDTVGPMARDVAGLRLGMELLEPGFRRQGRTVSVVGRFRAKNTDEGIDNAIDRVLAAWGVEVVEMDLPGWSDAVKAGTAILFREAFEVDRLLLEQAPEGIGEQVRAALNSGAVVSDDAVSAAHETARKWQHEIRAVFDRVELVALPTLLVDTPTLDGDGSRLADATFAVNVAGIPALSLPVPRAKTFAASLQLLGPWQGEDLLLEAGSIVERVLEAEFEGGVSP